MRSIIFIARKEFQELLRDGRFQWATVIGGILLLFSLLSGYKQYSDVSSLHQQAQATSREEWLNQGQKYPHSAAHYGSFAFKPKRLLSLLDNGLEKYMGVSIWIEAHKQNEAKSRYAEPDQHACLRAEHIHQAGPRAIFQRIGNDDRHCRPRRKGKGCRGKAKCQIGFKAHGKLQRPNNPGFCSEGKLLPPAN